MTPEHAREFCAAIALVTGSRVRAPYQSQWAQIIDRPFTGDLDGWAERALDVCAEYGVTAMLTHQGHRLTLVTLLPIELPAR